MKDKKDKVISFPLSNTNEEPTQPIHPMYIKDPDTVDIEAFNEEDDVLAGKTREELLEELGKTGVGIEEVKAKVIVDEIDGEKTSKKIGSGDLANETIESLQDINPESLKQQLHDIAKSTITMLLSGEMTDEEAEELVTEMEKKVVSVSRQEIRKMSTEEVRKFIGSEIYDSIKKFNPNASAAARNFLLDLKDSVVQVQGLVDTMEEMKLATEFFNKIDMDGIHSQVVKELEDEDGNYPTEVHRYLAYLHKYIEKLKSTDDYEKGNKFILEEISTSEDKIKAINEAVTFENILRRARTGRGKMIKDFKSMKIVNKVIWDFIGKLNSDPTINITFPVPKNVSEAEGNDPKVLAAIWLLFIELIDMHHKFPKLTELTHSEYYTLTNIVLGSIQVDETNEELVEVLKQFIDENNITKSDVRDSKKMAIVFTYILAKTFKPGRLNDTHTKYVLSYTMNILSQSMKPNYGGITHKLFSDIREILS